MTHVTCWLTAKNRDQLRNPTLGNRVWATFTFFLSAQSSVVCRFSLLALPRQVACSLSPVVNCNLSDSRINSLNELRQFPRQVVVCVMSDFVVVVVVVVVSQFVVVDDDMTVM